MLTFTKSMRTLSDLWRGNPAAPRALVNRAYLESLDVVALAAHIRKEITEGHLAAEDFETVFAAATAVYNLRLSHNKMVQL